MADNISKETKEKLFEQMLQYEHDAERFNESGGIGEGYDYTELSNGMFEALQILGISSEYINWAIGK